MERVVTLTAAERVLLHLRPFWNARDGVREITQEGIAEGTGMLRSHVPRALKRLLADGHAEVREGRLRGRGRKVRLYYLTESGIRRARDLLTGIEGEEVQFGERHVTIRELSEELRVTPLEIVLGLDDGHRFRPREAALAIPNVDLLERDTELRELAEWLHGPAAVMVIYASRGMGKTALAQAFLASARRPAVWVEVVYDDASAIGRQLAESLRRFGGSGSADALNGDIVALKPLIAVDGYGEVSEPVVDAMVSLRERVVAAPGAKLLVLAQESTPSYCRFYEASVVRGGAVRELRLKGLSPEATKRLLGNPSISEESLRQVYLLTKGCPLYLTLIRDGDSARLREVSRFTAAEVRLLMSRRSSD
ncbi:MAG TPA: hypothetical protein VIL58_00535 [Thermoplasmata archaeon]